MRSLDKLSCIMVLCALYYSSQSEGVPLRKRSVSEVQLMHSLGEHKYDKERQDWLQMKLKDIHTASLRSNAERGEKVRNRRLLPEDFTDFEVLTFEEKEYIRNLLEMLFNPQ
ncbi:PTHY protein, partial [Atractosteus spatula]|nr:PTHY protein [Atractosteus spatula]